MPFAIGAKKYPYGKNAWLESNARFWLRGEFLDGFDPDDAKAIVEVMKKTYCQDYENLDKAGEIREIPEKMFLLSCSELGFKNKEWQKFDGEGETYEFFWNADSDPDNDEEIRVMVDEDGDQACYFTRSANRGYAHYTWHVYTSGSVTSAGYATTAYALCPACGIA